MRLPDIVRTLIRHYGHPPAPSTRGVFEAILWENVAYLAPDDRRAAAFALLKKSVGTRPPRILAASTSALRAVAAHGILPDQFAEKLRECARIARDEFDGDVEQIVRRPPLKAKRALRRFPGIGEPGAEKILLFARCEAALAPESNGLRVLTRLGVCAELKSYAATYRAARDATRNEFADDYDLLMAAHAILRRHGQELCRRNDPACAVCPVSRVCQFAQRHQARVQR